MVPITMGSLSLQFFNQSVQDLCTSRMVCFVLPFLSATSIGNCAGMTNVSHLRVPGHPFFCLDLHGECPWVNSHLSLSVVGCGWYASEGRL